jgi:hypothetical protein
MATGIVEIPVRATAAAAWEAIRDIGAVHTRLAVGFVTATELVPGGRRVTFFNGAVVEEPIVTLDEARRRLVWSAAKGGITTHYNASAQVLARDGGSTVVWTADFLPDSAQGIIGEMIRAGAKAIAKTLGEA